MVSYGETTYEKRSDKPAMWYIADAVRRVVRKAGLQKQDVDGLAVASYRIAPDIAPNVAEHLGIELRWLEHCAWGGASGVISILRAARAVQSGDAEVVVCVAADNMTVAATSDLLGGFSVPFRDYVYPHGAGGANAVFALITRRYMYEYDVRPEDFGRLVIAQRANATLNANALLRQPLTLEEYLSARLIVDPLRLYDCVLPCCGGDAVVVTTAERARRLTDHPVYVRGGAESHNYRPRDPVQLTGAWAGFRESLYSQASVGTDDLDLVEVYDDYPVMALMQLEDLGFFPKGDGRRFLAEHDLTVSGSLPVNTGGGQLSAGQAGAAGGTVGVVEAVCQLQHEAGARQVDNARHALVAGYGTVSYDRGLCASAMILSIEEGRR